MIYQYGVTELLTNIKLTLAESFPLIYVIGEISEVNQNAKSKHVYFNITDAEGSLYCVCWHSVAKNYNMQAFSGKAVKIKAKISSFNNSKIYLNVAEITLNAEGVKQQQLEENKRILQEAGYFKMQKNKPIATYPKTIGLITSLSGAVLHDITTTLSNKHPVKLIIYHAKVQGEGSAIEIIQGINYFNTIKNADFIIIARGGGSEEDLSVFNDVNLVKAVATSNTAIVSAIGHQPNSTLCDMASAVYYATPTASVAWLPNKADTINNLANYYNITTYKLANYINTLNSHIALLNKQVFSPSKYMHYTVSSLNKIDYTINRNIYLLLNNHKSQINKISSAVKTPAISGYIGNLQLISYKTNNLKNNIVNHINNINYYNNIVESMSFKSVLQRGYSVIYQNGKVVDNITAITSGNYSIQAKDGTKQVTITCKN